ncbi:hypothetical protein ABER99_21535 [Paenibacillus glucanolyticus]|jgi:hypothetical protein|uniref:Uncharacterized protein n=1 Tax=Paenibacillus glucanolyticus TaxID=59843 RepID=A0A163GU33_9BACL|nr:hypothetical protein [Paenibacillus glucanolyticus]KZS45152.1 hypothetical protein AWU65_03990 [Paenibacillus glucanolyticus]OMF64430.1 hypothetical protein BK142_31935 [Paenibacillus glucanolyticus]
MDNKYIEEFTRDWELLNDEGNTQLWQYFDQLDWKHMYAIKIGGSVKSVFDSEYGNPHLIFNVVVKCL